MKRKRGHLAAFDVVILRFALTFEMFVGQVEPFVDDGVRLEKLLFSDTQRWVAHKASPPNERKQASIAEVLAQLGHR